MFPGGRRGLGADPARADDHHPSGVLERRTQRQRVVEGAQTAQSGQVPAGHRQRTRPRAGREHEPVEPVFTARVVVHEPGAEFDLGRGRTALEGDVLLRVEAVVVHPVGFIGLAHQQPFGQGR